MQSVKYNEKACELNTSRTGACTELGTIYCLGRRPDSKGVGIEADPVKAKEYFKKSCEFENVGKDLACEYYRKLELLGYLIILGLILGKDTVSLVYYSLSWCLIALPKSEI